MALFGIIPLLLGTRLVTTPLMPLLWTTSAICAWWLHRDGRLRAPWGGIRPLAPGEWRRILATFAPVAALLLAGVWFLRPQAKSLAVLKRARRPLVMASASAIALRVVAFGTLTSIG